MNKKEARISAFINGASGSVKIVQHSDDYTAFETVLTKEEFIQLVSVLAERWIIVFHHGSFHDKRLHPPSYFYTVVLIEQDANVEFPDWLRLWEPPPQK